MGMPLSERRSLSVVDRRRVSICRSLSGGAAGSRPGRRPYFLAAQEIGERNRRGLRPLDPRAASGWPSAKVGGALFTDQRTSLQHPTSRRAAGVMPLPERLRNRTGSSHMGGTTAFISLASPTGRRKTARLRRARAQSARTPGTGVVFRRGSWRAFRCALLGAQGARQLRPLPATDPAIGQADARAPHGRRVSDPPPCASTRQVRRTVVSIVGCTRNLN